MRCFNHSCQGESHKATEKECQDYSLAWQDKELGVAIAIVCDGHGGDSYFRSATGARLAAEITVAQIRQFLADVELNLFVGCAFTAFGTQDTIDVATPLYNSFRQLFESIYYHWRKAITEDGQRELTEWEKEHVEPKYFDLLKDEQRIVKAYGCTLMAYVCTKDFWFAFHLGDGKIVMLDSKFQFSQPVPWDEKCFLNKTTSLCGSEPIKDFRFCIQGDGHFPSAIFLGSDGLDDTYGDGAKLNSFYGDVVKELALQGQDAVESMLKEDLPQISKIGSQDDMSVAVVYDDNKIEDAAIACNDYQKELLKQEISDLQQKKKSKEYIIENAKLLEESIPTPSLLEKMRNGIKELEARIDKSRTDYEAAKQKYESTNLEKIKAEARMAKKELKRESQQIAHLEERLQKLKLFTLSND